MDVEKRYKINIDSNGKTFFYKGYIIKEDDFFITFNDKFKGEIRLNKKNIISIEEVKNDTNS